MEEEEGGVWAARVINSSGLWGEFPHTGPPHSCFHSSSRLTWASVSLVRLIKDTEDVSGKTQGEVETLREMTWEKEI